LGDRTFVAAAARQSGLSGQRWRPADERWRGEWV